MYEYSAPYLVIFLFLLELTDEVKVGTQMFAIATYVAEEEHENSMHLVEGERVYVLGKGANETQLFFKKNLLMLKKTLF